VNPSIVMRLGNTFGYITMWPSDRRPRRDEPTDDDLAATAAEYRVRRSCLPCLIFAW
jgi:hypothetical protein